MMSLLLIGRLQVEFGLDRLLEGFLKSGAFPGPVELGRKARLGNGRIWGNLVAWWLASLPFYVTAKGRLATVLIWTLGSLANIAYIKVAKAV